MPSETWRKKKRERKEKGFVKMKSFELKTLSQRCYFYLQCGLVNTSGNGISHYLRHFFGEQVQKHVSLTTTAISYLSA